MPTFGILLFISFYIVAAYYYPGGSQFDKNAVGFSWKNNYWCNLLNDNAINGMKNTAQPIAITAMVILCIALSLFWWQFPGYTSLGKRYKLATQVCGMLAMATGLLLFSKINHDLVTNLASLFGLLAMTGTFTGLHKNKWTILFYFGLLNVALVAVNNFLYYNKELISYLPLVQKMTFLTFLTWICCIDIKIFNLISSQPTNKQAI